MKHLILGTAGHIDHGKTALVKALTGIDCDTHAEEKRRGITINLGFAHLALSGGLTVGVVDVPGHRDFVQTMVSGSSGIDIAMLVVAADEGIMPQTREHVQIMEILGIRCGVIAVTKIDIVDESVRISVHDRIREFVKNTFLETAPICDVSSIAGTGIGELKEAIGRIAATIRERSASEVFRMSIDRIFSVSGFGTVVTGSVKSGALSVNKSVFLLPGKKELRVRRLERFGEEVTEVRAGDRASCNLVGLSREDFKRGMLISDRPLRSTLIADARLTLFSDSIPLGIWTHVILLKDTYETQARIHLLDTNTLKGGGRALVQMHLADPCVARSGDCFVIRSTSSDSTLGGGEIIDAAPLHHRRRPEVLLDGLSLIAGGEFPRRIAAEVQKHVFGIRIGHLAENLNCAPEEIAGAVSPGVDNEIMLFGSGSNCYAISVTHHGLMTQKVVKIIDAHHAKHPLEKTGLTQEELLGGIGAGGNAGYETFISMFLENLVKQGTLKKAGHTYALANHTVVLSGEAAQRTAMVEEMVATYGMQAPIPAELEKAAEKKGIDSAQFRSILKYLFEAKILYSIEGAPLHSRIVDECRRKLLIALFDKKDGMTVAAFRDLVQGNRKICLLLFAIFDREGITTRQGDVRILTEKGRESARSYLKKA